MAKRRRDVGASVRARLLNFSREKQRAFDIVLTRYVLERLLYRLSLSRHRERFALKGALLITTWFPDPHRPARDVDLLGFGDSSSEGILSVFREVCTIEADDGVTFDLETLAVELIREQLEFGGLRLRVTSRLAGARIPTVIDVGFGDAVEPGLEEIELPVLLDLPAPRLRAYPRETVIAEKFEAMVRFGRADSRMKDFYYIWLLSKTYQFDGERLARSIAATFKRRRTALPTGIPDALSLEFARDPVKREQWRGFVRDLATDQDPLEDVIEHLVGFLMPHADRARSLATATES
jgi:predicted nucleotidyltransferase component of viral defense system